MIRPCTCDKCLIGKSWDNNQCRICWLFHNDERYANLWSNKLNPQKKTNPIPFFCYEFIDFEDCYKIHGDKCKECDFNSMYPEDLLQEIKNDPNFK